MLISLGMQLSPVPTYLTFGGRLLRIFPCVYLARHHLGLAMIRCLKEGKASNAVRQGGASTEANKGKCFKIWLSHESIWKLTRMKLFSNIAVNSSNQHTETLCQASHSNFDNTQYKTNQSTFIYNFLFSNKLTRHFLSAHSGCWLIRQQVKTPKDKHN